MTNKNGKLKKSLTIPQWQRKIHEYAISKDWWINDRPIPELLCLLHSEVSEALEAYRNNNDQNFREELADVAIRLFDMCEGLKINLEEEITIKHGKNLLRSVRHGNKRC